MGLIAIGVINHNKDAVGIRIYDTNSGEFKDVPINGVKAVLSKGAQVCNLGLQDGELIGTNGSLDRYPVIRNGKLFGKSPLIILNEVGDVGYDVVDWKGKKARYRSEDVVTYSEKNGIANGKVVEKDGNKFISSISGNYDRVEIVIPKKKVQEVKTKQKSDMEDTDGNNKPTKQEKAPQVSNIVGLSDMNKKSAANKVKAVDTTSTSTSGSNSIKVDSSGYRAPVISIKSADIDGNKLLDTKLDMTVEQKLARAVLVIKNIDRFLYSLYISMEKVPVMDDNICPTMGVSIDTLYYNCKFIQEIPMPQLVFIMEHEMYHIAMMHNSRRGVRHHKVWNIAGDLFINKLICEEYGITPGMAPKRLEKDILGVGIQFGEGGLYNQLTNTQTETAESIYDMLMEQYNKAQQKRRQQGQQGQGQQGQGQGQQGQGQQGQQGEGQGQQGQGQGQGQQEQGQGQQGQGQQGQQGDYGHAPDKNKGSNGQGNTPSNQSESGDSSGNAGSNSNGEQQNQNGQSIDDIVSDLVYHGQKIGEIVNIGDLLQSDGDESLSKELQAAKEGSLLRRALTHSKRIGGHSESAIERMVRDALAPKIDWKRLLKSYLSKATQRVNTFGRPDKRFVSRGMIMPGPKALEPDKLHGVKVCIDTSGSISDEELDVALTQIMQMLKTYKAEAEMVYWDTAVRRVAPFKDKKELLRIKPAGGGGTDVSCVFDYFDSKECKVKPSVILVFTDGCFLKPSVKKWGRKYKDTIWIISGGTRSARVWDKPWGKVAEFKAN